MINEQDTIRDHATTVTLEKIRFASSVEMFNGSLAYREARNFMDEHLRRSLEYEVLGREYERVSVRYPADWWQALKARFAPRWFRRRWPVKEAEWSVQVRELFPGIAIPPHQSVYHVEVLKDGWRREPNASPPVT